MLASAFENGLSVNALLKRERGEGVGWRKRGRRGGGLAREVERFGISCRNIQNRLDLSRSGEIYMKMLSVFPFLFISLEF